jgi:hypothetical protein
MTGFTPSGRLATLKMFNEAESGSRFRITADAFAFRGSDRRITPTAARSATGRTNNYPGQFLATDKNRQASPDAPEGNMTCFRFFGQMILLFWTAGGELSDVEEQFREAR